MLPASPGSGGAAQRADHREAEEGLRHRAAWEAHRAQMHPSRVGLYAAWGAVLLASSACAAAAFAQTHPDGGAAGRRGLPADLTPQALQDGLQQAAAEPFPSPIRFLTVLSHPYRMACKMLESAAHVGVPMEIIGWGGDIAVKDFNRKEEKLKKKIPFLYSRVHDWADDTLLMFIDGGDVLWQSGPEAIYTAFRQLLDETHRVVFGSERNCWIRSLPRETCKDWPTYRGSPYRWLNSGCWIGEVGALRGLLSHVNESVERITMENCPKCGDQALFGRAYIAEGWNRSVRLDHFNTICQNLHSAQADFCEHQPGDKVRNCVTKSTPALFHFNGNPQHPDLNPKLWLQKMWWNGKPVPRTSTVTIDGTRHYLDEICPKLNFDGPAPPRRPPLRSAGARSNAAVDTQGSALPGGWAPGLRAHAAAAGLLAVAAAAGLFAVVCRGQGGGRRIR
eukprot:TRINITY_DN20573_c0_g1_i1.p1 TRINITY_DN20573_c0_g1~~TRINITY_DN20573_c0_g1_i1.p1  ORF type:complete len:449 (+),score=96.84 TRINITY_DN20573_c0_g1_i1:92-1438(+)